jgi:hypothetical protein
MKILQKEYDPVIRANVITRYEKPIYYLDFDNVNESKLDETSPNKMIGPFLFSLCHFNSKDNKSTIYYLFLKIQLTQI